MHFLTALLPLVASLADLTQAAPPGQAAPPWQPNPKQPSPSSTLVSSTCYSRWATNSGLWQTGTQWNTKTVPCTSTITTTVKTTSTPSQGTTTSTVTATTTVTASTTTSTATSTVTSTTSTTTITTSTTTSTTTTTTTTTATSTVAAPSGFLPIQSSLPGSSYSGSGGSDPVSKRGLKKESRLLNVRGTAQSPAFNGSGPGRQSKPRFAAGVSCQKTVPQPTCSTTQITTTTTVTASAPSLATVTSTTTVTTTSYPGATTTTTTTTISTSTITTTSTTTSTSTFTETSTAPTASVYAACSTNNLADTYSGVGFVFIGPAAGDWNEVVIAGPTSAYECCVAALNDANGSLVWYWNFQGNNQCYSEEPVAGGSCSQTTNPWNAQTGAVGATIGNGPCGEYTSTS